MQRGYYINGCKIGKNKAITQQQRNDKLFREFEKTNDFRILEQIKFIVKI